MAPQWEILISMYEILLPYTIGQRWTIHPGCFKRDIIVSALKEYHEHKSNKTWESCITAKIEFNIS